ncbi:unnamed protein product [Protopolystoma xenopodis]|uniref:Uncharacterized protein n=1 Tax=Protopolystoma xenopodis TaxID=117903 RepID=A0A448WK94_9PLAT|nr:unnamed protein product [Protopolystoma xenopodis]
MPLAGSQNRFFSVPSELEGLSSCLSAKEDDALPNSGTGDGNSLVHFPFMKRHSVCRSVVLLSCAYSALHVDGLAANLGVVLAGRTSTHPLQPPGRAAPDLQSAPPHPLPTTSATVGTASVAPSWGVLLTRAGRRPKRLRKPTKWTPIGRIPRALVGWYRLKGGGKGQKMASAGPGQVLHAAGLGEPKRVAGGEYLIPFLSRPSVYFPYHVMNIAALLYLNPPDVALVPAHEHLNTHTHPSRRFYVGSLRASVCVCDDKEMPGWIALEDDVRPLFASLDFWRLPRAQNQQASSSKANRQLVKRNAPLSSGELNQMLSLFYGSELNTCELCFVTSISFASISIGCRLADQNAVESSCGWPSGGSGRNYGPPTCRRLSRF